MTLSFNTAKALCDAGIVFERTEKAYLHVEGREPYQGVRTVQDMEVIRSCILDIDTPPPKAREIPDSRSH